ncbi:MAG: hypothetical protein HUU46_03195 [Candidatus Hydrogenedentes bacterium]|nr:hypothetical protein [Candidatus Hydrogenedentota bacterium]
MSPETDSVVFERTGRMRVWRRVDVPLAAVRDVVNQPGEILKRNEKSCTKRVGAFVIKSSEGPIIVQLIKHTAQRARYRRGWRAALFLADHGIPAARPVAHVEWGSAGLIWRHATITEYIGGCRDVEHYYDELVRRGGAPDVLNEYLKRIADAVNALTATGAIHTDLAGKNILTPDGEKFFFIDLDGIVLGEDLDESRRFQLHVQLYDSFIDRCGDDDLAPFVRAMLPGNDTPFDVWFARVKAAQAVRRSRTVAAWKREGKL